MAVAFDASSESHSGTTLSTSVASFSWTHTPVGTPAGVLVFVFTDADADYITSVTYGGVALTQVSEAADTAGEPMRSTAFFLGQPSRIPTGAQTVEVTRTNNATGMYAVAITVTAGTNRDTEVTGATTVTGDGTVAESSITDGSPGADSMRFAGGAFGHATLPSAGASSTLLQSIDPGANGYVVVRETTAGQGSRSVGMSSGTSDDRAVVLLALREVLAPGLLTETVKAVGSGFAQMEGFIRVTDTVSAALYPGPVSGQETIKVADSVSAVLDLGAVLSDAVKVADAPSAALLLAADGLTAETVRVADVVTVTLDPEETSLVETVRVVDAATAALEHFRPVTDETVRVADQVAVTLDPLEASAQDVVLVADSVNAEYGTTISTLQTAQVKVADAVTPTIDPEEATPSDAIRVADVVTPALQLAVAVADDVVRVADTLSANADHQASLIDTVRVADTATPTLDPEQATGTDTIRVADVLTAVLDNGRQVTDAVRVGDVVTAILDPLEASPTEGVTPQDAVTASLTPLLPAVAPSDSVRVADAITVALTPLLASLSESVKVADQVSLTSGSQATQRLNAALPVERLVAVEVSPIRLSARDSGAYTLAGKVPV